MPKITLNNLVNLQNENTAVTKINQNNNTIELAFDNTLSRDGSQPNQMQADLDMNSNDIINVKEIVLGDGMTWAQLPTSPNEGDMIIRKDDKWSVLPVGSNGSFIGVTGGYPAWNPGAGLGDMVAAANLSDVQSASASAKALGLYLTTAQLASTSISSDIQVIRTAGRSTMGDGGSVTLIRTDTPPSHAGKFQSLDGSWWVINEPILNAAVMGMLPGIGLDVPLAQAINAAAGLGIPLFIPEGSYSFTSEVNFSAMIGSTIYLGGNVVFDFKAATNASNFPHFGFIYIGGDDYVALPELSANALSSTATLSFSSAHGLIEGDRICIWNPTESSYSGWRTYYFAGEFCKVAYPDGLNVGLFGTLFATYGLSDVIVYKHPNKSITVTGGTIKILESRETGFSGVAGIVAERIVDSDLSAFHSTRAIYAGMLLSQCVGIYGTGYNCNILHLGGDDNNYGLVYSNSQDINISGEFNGGRHGVTGGGSVGVGCVPSRNVHVKGTFKNSPTAAQGIGAAGFHGNCEYCSYEGIFEGGVTVAGNHNNIYGDIRPKVSQNGVGAYFGELVGTDFKISGKFTVVDAPSGSPVISIGDFGTSPMTADTVTGGTFDFSGVEFDCPKNTRLITVQNHAANPADKIILDVRGAKWLRSDVSPTHSLIVIAVASRGVDVVLMDGFVNGPNAPYSMAGAAKIRGWRNQGTISLGTDTGSSETTSANITLNAPKVPTITLGQRTALFGGSRSYAYVYDVTNTYLRIGAITCSGSNFANSDGGLVSWQATVDD